MDEPSHIEMVTGQLEHVQIEANEKDGQYLLCKLVAVVEKADGKADVQRRAFYLKAEQTDAAWFGLVLGMLRDGLVHRVTARIMCDRSAAPLGAAMQIVAVRLQAPGV